MLWADLAKHLVMTKIPDPFKNFLSSNFTLTTSIMNEFLLLLAVLDLDFKEGSHGFKSGQGRKVEIKAASNFIIFMKEIEEAQASVNRNLLVVQRYFE